MRVVLDTNILISALLLTHSAPAQAVIAWRRGQFELVTCELQLQELRDVTRRPKIRTLIRPAMAGELVNQLRSMALMAGKLPPSMSRPTLLTTSFYHSLKQAKPMCWCLATNAGFWI